MLYLSQMMGKPVVDATGEKIGTISDLAISTGEDRTYACLLLTVGVA